MKLRNKKTGEVLDVYFDNYINENNIVVVCLKVKDEVSPDGYKYIASYINLVEFLEEWEDYEPQEPLIKDKEIRKLVKAWAEVNDYNEVMYDGSKDCIYSPYGSDDTDTSVSISFDDYCALERLEHKKLYTITELCGEEKKC